MKVTQRIAGVLVHLDRLRDRLTKDQARFGSMVKSHCDEVVLDKYADRLAEFEAHVERTAVELDRLTGGSSAK
jgi:hypothetical protein